VFDEVNSVALYRVTYSDHAGVDNTGPCEPEKRHWHIESCSAVTGEGLLEGFDWVVKDIGARIYMYD
jgi:hypothetical protein